MAKQKLIIDRRIASEGSLSSSSCCAASMDIPDPLSPLLPIIHHFGRSSGLHPVSSQSCCMYIPAGCPAFERPYVGVHRSTSLMSSLLLLQQCPACLVHLTWIVFMTGGKWHIVGVLRGCTSRTCSILLTAFLCNCCLAFSPAVLLSSK